MSVLRMWYDAASMDVSTKPGRGVVIGLPIWGMKFWDRFWAYFLPTLLERESREALRGSRVVIFTREEDRTQGHVRIFLEECGIGAEFRIIPPEVMHWAAGQRDGQYQVMGVAQDISMMIAGAARMGMATTHPDVLHAAGYFSRLLELGERHDAVINTGLSAIESGIVPELAAYLVGDGTLEIPARDLGDLSLRHIHPRLELCLVRRHEPLPSSHLLLWRGESEVHALCPHRNPAYLSPRLVREMEVEFGRTMDTQIARAIPGDFHAAAAEDGLVATDVSDETVDNFGRLGSLEDMVAAYRHVEQGDPRYGRFAAADVRIPVGYEPGQWSDAEIAAHRAEIMRAVTRQD